MSRLAWFTRASRTSYQTGYTSSARAGRDKITTYRLRATMGVMGIPGGEAVGTEDTVASLPLRGFACVAHVFAAHVCADPGQVWTALTDPGQTAGYLYGLAAHSTWVPGDPIEFRVGDRVELTGRVVCIQRHERLSYLPRSGLHDPPVYLTWLLRPTPGECRFAWRSTKLIPPTRTRTRKISGCPSSLPCNGG